MDDAPHRLVAACGGTSMPGDSARRGRARRTQVDVLLRVYAKCINGQREVANQRILAALVT